MLPLASGARADIRDEEWLVRRFDPATDGGWLLTCDGVSELVRGRDALFLTELEDQIGVLDPATTRLVADDSPTCNASLLCLESMRRRSVPNDARVHLGHRGVMNVMPHQTAPAERGPRKPCLRILIRDVASQSQDAGYPARYLGQHTRRDPHAKRRNGVYVRPRASHSHFPSVSSSFAVKSAENGGFSSTIASPGTSIAVSRSPSICGPHTHAIGQ